MSKPFDIKSCVTRLCHLTPALFGIFSLPLKYALGTPTDGVRLQTRSDGRLVKYQRDARLRWWCGSHPTNFLAVSHGQFSPKLAKTTGFLATWKGPGADLGEEGRGGGGEGGPGFRPNPLNWKEKTFCNRPQKSNVLTKTRTYHLSSPPIATNYWDAAQQFTYLITGSLIRDNLSFNTEISQRIGKATCWNDHVTFTNCHVYVTCLPHIILRIIFFFFLCFFLEGRRKRVGYWRSNDKTSGVIFEDGLEGRD